MVFRRLREASIPDTRRGAIFAAEGVTFLNRIRAFQHDNRPGDFAVRLARNAPAFAARRRRKHRGRKLLALAAAFAVPAVAAPAEWQGFDALEAAPEPEVVPMGFEVAGESFPGSAFYYLEDVPYVPLPVEAEISSDADPTPVEQFTGPAARSLVVEGAASDKARALQCMTMAIYYEAASESDAGQRAVAQVVLNRVAHPAYPNSVCGVVFQGSERKTGCQFTFTCDGSLARQPSRTFWDRARRVAEQAISGAVYAPVGLATHYHTVQIHPYWADSLTHVGTIGAHRFYRWSGAAGRQSAFRATYSGHEPAAAPHSRTPVDEAASIDPVELARIYEAALAPARPLPPLPQASAYRAPDSAFRPEFNARGSGGAFTNDRLPQSGDVRPEYQQSGQWLARP